MLLFRQNKIVELCKNKSVLHLGFVHHDYFKDKVKADSWLHLKISKVANELLGLDILKSQIEMIEKEFGFKSIVADVTKLEKVNIKKKFDVIVCGELIEHIDNPGLMLDGIKKFMHKDSILIITTPNPWSKRRLSLLKRGKDEFYWMNEEHVSWYSFMTLKNLLDRHGYEKVFYSFYDADIKEITFPEKKSIINFFLKLYRYFYFSSIPPYFKDGLFFVSKLKK